MSNDPEGKVAPNPDYGSGVFRRRIRLTQSDTEVLVELEDCSHAMRLSLSHDHQSIISVEGDVIRAPVTSCSSAPEKLASFIGLPLYQDLDHYRSETPQNIHCTHLYDMALLAVTHSQSTIATRQFDVTIHDEQEGIIDADICLDGRQIHHWLLENGQIAAPTAHAGQSVFKGFIAWAKNEFSGVNLSCAFALQRGLMVAGARRWDMYSVAGQPADTFGPSPGVCYSYSEGRDKHAVRSENPTRDFTDCPEQLLKFQ